MVQILENISLKPFNTFGIDSTATYFVQAETVNELIEIINHPIYKANPKLILGGGSNILFTSDFQSLVVSPAIKGIHLIDENNDFVYVRAGSGEVWDDIVAYTVSHGWGGLENLSYIPGHVGAAPVQNIGAYGVEVKDAIYSVEFLDATDGTEQMLSNKECHFGYRESVFKHEYKNKFMITSVSYKLKKQASHQF